MNMKTIKALVIVCIAVLAAPAVADSYSAVSGESSRVRRVEYKDNVVVSAIGYSDHPILIDLDPKEPIEDKAGGKMSNWEVYKNGARMYVRPLDDARPMTLIVATKTRSYVFDFAPGPGKPPAGFVSKIIFTYPELASSPEVVEKKDKELRDARSPLGDALKAARNMKYSVEKTTIASDIQPREVFDDGRFTYFKFPANLPIPAIYQSTPGSKDEWLVNSHKDGEYVVMHAVGASWNLRAGPTLLGIFNDAYDAAGAAPIDDTTISGMKREVRHD